MTSFKKVRVHFYQPITMEDGKFLENNFFLCHAPFQQKLSFAQKYQLCFQRVSKAYHFIRNIFPNYLYLTIYIKPMNNPFQRQHSHRYASPYASSPRGFVSPFISTCPQIKYAGPAMMWRSNKQKYQDQLMKKMAKEYYSLKSPQNKEKNQGSCQQSLIKPAKRSIKVQLSPCSLKMKSEKSTTQGTLQSSANSLSKKKDQPYFISKRGSLADLTRNINPYNQLKTKIKQAEKQIRELYYSQDQTERLTETTGQFQPKNKQKKINTKATKNSLDKKTRNTKAKETFVWNNKTFFLLNQ